jgi:hypothetical protein
MQFAAFPPPSGTLRRRLQTLTAGSGKGGAPRDPGIVLKTGTRWSGSGADARLIKDWTRAIRW